MKKKIWLKATFSLFSVVLTFSCQVCSANLVHTYSNDQYQMMNLPSENLVMMDESMDGPPMGFALVDNGQGDMVSYGLPGAMIPHVGSFYDNDDLCCDDFRGLFRFDLEFAAGKYIAIDENYGGIGLFVVPEAPRHFANILLDIKAFKLEQRNWAGSFGIGMRYLDPSLKKVYGMNVFYDYLDQHGSFNQIGVGFELFSKCWEFHLNGYLPIGKLHHALSERILMFNGGFVGIFREDQNALRGIEMSAGGRWYLCDNLNLYVAPGLYFYNNKDLKKNVEGVQGTVELNWNEWIYARVNASYDRRFKGRVQGLLAISIPFDFDWCCRNSCCCNPCDMLDYRVRRNDLIFLRRCCSVERNWDDCGRLIQQ